MIEVVAHKVDLIQRVDDPHNMKHSPAWDFFGNDPAAKPEVRCDCGEWVNIKTFHISADGMLTPSFLHEACGWHVMLQLGEWPGQEFIAGEP